MSAGGNGFQGLLHLLETVLVINYSVLCSMNLDTRFAGQVVCTHPFP